jgi:hypothetical protein
VFATAIPLVPAARLELARLAAADFESVYGIEDWRGFQADYFRNESAESVNSAL